MFNVWALILTSVCPALGLPQLPRGVSPIPPLTCGDHRTVPAEGLGGWFGAGNPLPSAEGDGAVVCPWWERRRAEVPGSRQIPRLAEPPGTGTGRLGLRALTLCRWSARFRNIPPLFHCFPETLLQQKVLFPPPALFSIFGIAFYCPVQVL